MLYNRKDHLNFILSCISNLHNALTKKNPARCHTMSGRTGTESGGERLERRKRQCVDAHPRCSAKNSLRNKHLPTAVQSITLAGSRQAERGRGWGAQRSELRL